MQDGLEMQRDDEGSAEANTVRDPLVHRIIACAIEVHRTLGPGLLESTYTRCLAYELLCCDVQYREQVPVPVHYKGVHLECGYRLDLLVDDRVILEIKSVEKVMHVHRAQLHTYMRLTDVHVGYLMNFNSPRLVDGIHRVTLRRPDATNILK